jgi:hypothetical protein
MNKSKHVISPDLEYNLPRYSTSYPGMIRAMYEIPLLIIAASRTGGFCELPLLPNQVELSDEIKKFLLPSSDENHLLVKMASGARQILVKVFASEPITEDLPDLQLHINFIAVGERNKPFFKIELRITRIGPSQLLRVWQK